MGTKLAVSKPGYNVLTDTNPSHLIFSSDFGTLKYFAKASLSLTIDALSGNWAGKVSYTHNLGYAPYVEIYMQNPIDEYEYVPVFGSGATTMWTADFAVTTTKVDIYVEETGFTLSNPTFRFLIFIFKNDTGLL